jgi:hypothetical protein
LIPRYQRILFWSLAGCILLMILFLLRGCEQAHERLTSVDDATPIAAPSTAPAEEITLYLASDADASISTASRQLALPEEPSIRARTLLNTMLAEYALPASPHPLQGGQAVDDVFLLGLPSTTASEFSSPSTQVAVVNLHGTFATNQPSGIGVEELTIQSIVGTLHAAYPELKQVRFLVDGQPRDTLSGHADLERAYPAIDTSWKPALLIQEGAQR